MPGTMRAADIAPTSFAHAVHAAGLQVKAGRHLAVNGLDLSLGTGVHGLLGPNGAGKTTLMRALATVLRPAAGELTLLGQDVTDSRSLRAIRRRLGYMPQQIGFYPRFTVAEFVAHLAWLKEMPNRDVPAAVERAIARVGLADRANSQMRTLSGGMVRRAGMAQAIVNSPDVLLLDEPTAGLDPEQRVSFRALLRDLGADTCVLVSTHLVEDVAAACTDVILMDEGTRVFDGQLQQLLDADPGPESDSGGSPVERAYTAVLTRHRGRSGTGW
jgi:ABC-2 type transport system ATP-binding protein